MRAAHAFVDEDGMEQIETERTQALPAPESTDSANGQER